MLAATDGSIWIAGQNGLTRWKNGQATVFDTASGLPHDRTQSLFQDDRGRIWVFTDGGLAYLTNDDRFVGVPGVPSKEVFSMTGDRAGGLWLSTHKSLLHMRDGRLVESFDWPVMGRHQQAKAVVPDQGGVWLAFWSGGGVLYFGDGKVRASYTPADGLGEGPVAALQLDRDGALWAATQQGGLSRIKDGRVATLTTRNGLPCDTIHWSMEDDDRSLWLYAALRPRAYHPDRTGRVDRRPEAQDRNRRLGCSGWCEAQRSCGVLLQSFRREVHRWEIVVPVKRGGPGRRSPSSSFNRVPPPVHIEQVFADGTLVLATATWSGGSTHTPAPADS